MAITKCCVCLETSPTLQDITSRAGDSPSWIDKLRDISPEMNWLEDSGICNSCSMRVEEAFTSESSLLHIQDSSVSNEIKTEIIEIEYNCIHCQKSFSEIDELEHHEKINHAIIKEELSLVMYEEKETIRNKMLTPFSCSKCPESFSTTASLYKHSSTRHNTPTYKCPLCEKAFLQPGVLNNHIQEHQNFRKFCYHCNRSYNTKQALQLHLRTEGLLTSTKKQFSCEVCEEIFVTGAEVISHCVQKHSMDVNDIKPYKCNVCFVAYCTSRKMSYHKRRAHRK